MSDWREHHAPWTEPLPGPTPEQTAQRAWDLGVEMNRQRADFIRRQQEDRAVNQELLLMRRESAIQAVQDRLERDLAMAVGCTDYPVSVRKRAEEYVAAVLSQFGIR